MKNIIKKTNKNLNCYLVIYGRDAYRINAINPSTAIVLYAKNKLGYSAISVNKEIASLKELILTLPEIRCYLLANDEQMRVLPTVIQKYSEQLKTLVFEEEKRKTEEAVNKDTILIEANTRKRELALLKQLQEKYAHEIYGPKDSSDWFGF